MSLLISIHIPKTAGTTFGAILQKKYKEKFLYVYNSNFPGKYCFGQTLGELHKNRMDEQKTALSKTALYRLIKDLGIECVHGHIPYCVVDDATSYFGDVNYITWVREPKARTYSDYLHFRRNGNTQDTELLIQSLANRMNEFIGQDPTVFSFIGRTEHFNEDLKRFGIEVEYEVLNTTPPTPENKEIKEIIDRYVDVDTVLYDLICQGRQ